MSMKTIIGGAIILFDWIDEKTIERVTSLAVLPKEMAEGWEGERLNVIDWKINPEEKTVLVTYQTRNDAYAPILDATLALSVERTKLTPPTRSRNWQWNEFSPGWRNRKTGERVSV
jgi:hypothetical protein